MICLLQSTIDAAYGRGQLGHYRQHTWRSAGGGQGDGAAGGRIEVKIKSRGRRPRPLQANTDHRRPWQAVWRELGVRRGPG